jgi:hypothetical protein
MRTQKDFLQALIAAINQSGIPYMLSGSMSSSFHGQPRATNDVDIVIDPPSEQQLTQFLDLLGAGYYVSRPAVKESLKNRSMFNVIDIESGWKADLMICKSRPYSQQEFSRRRQAVILGIELFIVSPEDSILTKLEWSKDGQSRMQFEDALNVFRLQRDNLDLDYLQKWAAELNIADLLEKLTT